MTRTMQRIETTDKFDSMLRFISEKGGRYQRAAEDFAKELGFALATFRKYVARAEELRILEVVRTSHPVIGVGRLPNTYRLKVTLAEWIASRDTFIEAMDQRRADERSNVARARSRARREPAAPLGDEIPEQMLTRPVQTGFVAPPPPDYSAPGSDIDVDAWAADWPSLD